MAFNGVIIATVSDEPTGNPATGTVYIWVDSTTGRWKQKDSSGTVSDYLFDAGSDSNKYKIAYKNTDYTLNPLVDQVIVCHNTTGTMTVTIPLASNAPNDGYGREITLINLGTAVAEVTCSGSDKFSNGLDTMNLIPQVAFKFAYAYPTLGVGLVKSSRYAISLTASRSAIWSSFNFSSATAVPLDSLDLVLDSNVFNWEVATPTRLLINATGSYKIRYYYQIDSTGGSSYNVTSYVRKNGTTELADSRGTAGNYQTEDIHMNVGAFGAILSAGDYLEFMLDQNSLTGNLSNFVVSIDTEL